MNRYFTSEAVTEGHPDKLCDQISDTLLDAILEQDPDARVALETMVTTGQVHVAGEVTTTAWIDANKLIREKLLDIGYDSGEKGFDGKSVGINLAIGSQSPDIAQGVDRSLENREEQTDLDIFDIQGAGDQGLMFGYACDETPELMPLPITLAHKLAQRLTQVRKHGGLYWLRPDGKTQVTIGYQDGKPHSIRNIVISAQHDPEVDQDVLEANIRKLVIEPIIRGLGLNTNALEIFINPTGKFVIGGPQGDAGLTGRKIIVDTYGGYARHGGGAFSGKDPSKVDRSAAYAARWIAKHVVAAELATKCEIQVAYAIGVAKPLAVYVDTFGTGRVSDDTIATGILETFDLRPAAIIEELDLKRPIYAATATGGHFGRKEFPWEETPLVSDLITNTMKIGATK